MNAKFEDIFGVSTTSGMCDIEIHGFFDLSEGKWLSLPCQNRPSIEKKCQAMDTSQVKVDAFPVGGIQGKIRDWINMKLGHRWKAGVVILNSGRNGIRGGYS